MQGILGTSKKNPIFHVEEDDSNSLLIIYYGLTHFATIPNDKRSLIFKSMVVILINAGICIRHIQEAFNISHPTVKRYKEAFDSKVYNLKNAGRETYQVTDDVETFIVERACYYESRGIKKKYHRKIIADIQDKFGKTVCRESIRLCLKKNQERNGEEPANTDTCKTNNNENGIIIPEKNDNIIISTCEVVPDSNVFFRNQYAGLLILSYYGGLIFEEFTENIPQSIGYSLRSIITWWMLSIFSGAVNLEQQRYFVIKDFEFISGYTGFPSVETMRKLLYSLSLPEEVEMTTILLRKNIEYFVQEEPVYYFDSHFEEYTGKKKILSGWNTLKNRANKGILDHFVHDSAGNPVFTIQMDNFYDFREVIVMLMDRLKSLSTSKPLTLVYDRGGFSVDLMKTISFYKNIFITWQKGFREEESEVLLFDKEIEIEYHYNELGNIQYNRFKYTEDVWISNEYSCRRIIFEKETDVRGKFHQAILTNDEKTDAGLIIKTILKRSWQENDFKKQKNNFGLEEITSYRYVEYNTFNDKDAEKTIKNKKYQEILNEIRELKDKKKELLKQLGVKVLIETELDKKFREKNKKVIDEILSLDESIKKKTEETQKISKETSRLEQIIDEGKVELDLRMKRLFTMIKIICRNIVEEGAREFLEIYTNLRDYQKVFRKLIGSAGEIKINGDTMIIKLDSFGRTKFKEKINKYLDCLNKCDLKSMDGKYRLRFEAFS